MTLSQIEENPVKRSSEKIVLCGSDYHSMCSNLIIETAWPPRMTWLLLLSFLLLFIAYLLYYSFLLLYYLSYYPCCRGVAVLTTAEFHSTKPELSSCAGTNPARGVSEIRDGEDLWQWSRLEIKLNAFRWSTIPQKQFITLTLFQKTCME